MSTFFSKPLSRRQLWQTVAVIAPVEGVKMPDIFNKPAKVVHEVENKTNGHAVESQSAVLVEDHDEFVPTTLSAQEIFARNEAWRRYQEEVVIPGQIEAMFEADEAEIAEMDALQDPEIRKAEIAARFFPKSPTGQKATTLLVNLGLHESNGQTVNGYDSELGLNKGEKRQRNSRGREHWPDRENYADTDIERDRAIARTMQRAVAEETGVHVRIRSMKQRRTYGPPRTLG